MKSSTPFLLAALIVAKIAICSFFVFQLEFDSFFWGSDAIASETEKKAAAAPAVAAGGAAEERIDLNFIVQKMDLLKKKEQELELKKAELLNFQQEIEKKMTRLTELRNEIKAEMDRKETVEKQKIKHLIKAYSAMKPQSAAALIEKQDRSLAIELLAQMKGETVGQILSYVENEKAARLIEGLARRK